MASPSTSTPSLADGMKPVADAARPQQSQAVPRKRRRRTLIANASEDCSACRKRQTRCDRVRPYCTQCVELGRECPGYKTTLTWGVGVASRGKLRGLALPIANSKKVQGASTKEVVVRRQAVVGSAGSSSSNNIRDNNNNAATGNRRPAAEVTGSRQAKATIDDCAAARRNGLNLLSPQPSGNVPELSAYPAIPHNAAYAAATTTHPPSATSSFSAWDFSSGYQEHLPAPRQSSSVFRPLPLQRVHTQFSMPYDDCGSPASTASWSDVGYRSPSELSRTPEELSMWDAYLDQYPTSYSTDHHSPPLSSTDGSAAFLEAPRSCPALMDDMSSSVSSDQTSADSPDYASLYVPDLSTMSMPGVGFHGHTSMMLGGAPFGAFSCSPDMGPSLAGSYPPRETSTLADFAPRSSIPFTPKSIARGPFSTLSPRLRYLIRYYETAICPYVSALNETNPYKHYILPLAEHSQSLQHAIAALSLNNMRMRRIPAPETVLDGRRTMFVPAVTPDFRSSVPEATTEELSYKASSIELLDSQLKGRPNAKDDAVLATLLVLCLYHTCDSGFSKFRTQLVGVQRLINMWERHERTGFICWVETFFVWFDVLTATVNGRETEVQASSIESLDLSVQGALEYHTGCDLRLFKLISQLGRLNLLSQNRPVKERDAPMTLRPPRRETSKDYYSLNVLDLLDQHSQSEDTQPHVQPSEDHVDSRGLFWSEWTEIKGKLQSWDFDPSNPLHSEGGLPKPALCSATPRTLPTRQRDMMHINEAFRYSALLYVERLARLSLPCSSLDIQNKVAQGLYHVTQVGVSSSMNKFLLWPLFIIGTECIDEMHRAIIRERCVKIHQESGFFNNLGALEVLEKVWKQEDQGALNEWVSDDDTNGEIFRWRNAMDRVDGEYIII